MATLQGTLSLDRVVVTEVVNDPNKTPVAVVSGSSGGPGGGSPKVESVSKAGEFREYGNGNVRLITSPAVRRTRQLALRAISPAQLDVIEGLLGQTICYRDPYGKKTFGAFIDYTFNAIPHSGYSVDGSLKYDVGLTIRTVSFDEAV